MQIGPWPIYVNILPGFQNPTSTLTQPYHLILINYTWPTHKIDHPTKLLNLNPIAHIFQSKQDAYRFILHCHHPRFQHHRTYLGTHWSMEMWHGLCSPPIRSCGLYGLNFSSSSSSFHFFLSIDFRLDVCTILTSKTSKTLLFNIHPSWTKLYGSYFHHHVPNIFHSSTKSFTSMSPMNVFRRNHLGLCTDGVCSSSFPVFFLLWKYATRLR